MESIKNISPNNSKIHSTETKVTTKSKKKGVLRNIREYAFFAGPATIIFFTVMILPFLYGFFLTFTNWDGISSSFSFIGIDNYKVTFTDPAFLQSLWLTIKYVVATVVITNVLAFSLAAVLTSGIKGQNFFRSGFFTPNLIGGVLLGFVWQFIFNNVLTSIGETIGVEFLESSFLTDPKKAFWALVIVSVWQYSGYMMIIYVTGFLNVPKDVLEAASIDGANWLQKLKSVTLPLMMSSFTISLFLTLQRAFMVYDVNLSLTGGGPFKSTEMISMFVYKKAFTDRQYGIGQSQALILFVIVAIVTVAQVYSSKKMEVEA